MSQCGLWCCRSTENGPAPMGQHGELLIPRLKYFALYGFHNNWYNLNIHVDKNAETPSEGEALKLHKMSERMSATPVNASAGARWPCASHLPMCACTWGLCASLKEPGVFAEHRLTPRLAHNSLARPPSLIRRGSNQGDSAHQLCQRLLWKHLRALMSSLVMSGYSHTSRDSINASRKKGKTHTSKFLEC